MRIAQILVYAAVTSGVALLITLDRAWGRPDSPAAASKHAGDEQAIRLVFEGLTAAWARGDGAGFAAAFSTDARFVNIEGLALAGRADIEKHHAALFAGPYKGTRAAVGATAIRFLRPDVAIVAVSAAVLPPDAPEAVAEAAKTNPPFVITCTLARDERGWAIESFQNTPKQAPRATPDKP